MSGKLKRAMLESLLDKMLDKQRAMNDQALQLSEQMKANNDALEAKHELYWGPEGGKKL